MKRTASVPIIVSLVHCSRLLRGYYKGGIIKGGYSSPYDHMYIRQIQNCCVTYTIYKERNKHILQNNVYLFIEIIKIRYTQEIIYNSLYNIF